MSSKSFLRRVFFVIIPFYYIWSGKIWDTFLIRTDSRLKIFCTDIWNFENTIFTHSKWLLSKHYVKISPNVNVFGIWNKLCLFFYRAILQIIIHMKVLYFRWLAVLWKFHSHSTKLYYVTLAAGQQLVKFLVLMAMFANCTVTFRLFLKKSTETTCFWCFHNFAGSKFKHFGLEMHRLFLWQWAFFETTPVLQAIFMSSYSFRKMVWWHWMLRWLQTLNPWFTSQPGSAVLLHWLKVFFFRIGVVFRIKYCEIKWARKINTFYQICANEIFPLKSVLISLFLFLNIAKCGY